MAPNKKVYICMASVPEGGHINCLLPIAAELLRTGKCRVEVATAGEREAQVRKLHPDIEFFSTGDRGTLPIEEENALKDLVFDPAAKKSPLDMYKSINALMECMNDPIYEALKKRWADPTQRPDFLIFDSITGSAQDAADHYGIPYASMSITAQSVQLGMSGMNEWNLPWHIPAHTPIECVTADTLSTPWGIAKSQLIKHVYGFIMKNVARHSRNKNRIKDGLPPVQGGPNGMSHISNAGLGRCLVVCQNATANEVPRSYPACFISVGPVCDFDRAITELEPSIKQWLSKKGAKPVVYISTGTNGYFAPAQVYSMMDVFTRLKDEFRFLWALPAKAQKNLPPDYLEKNVDTENMLVMAFAPQAAILASGYVVCHLTHCGGNSLNEACYLGVPSVGCELGADLKAFQCTIVEQGAGLACSLAGTGESGLSEEKRALLVDSIRKVAAPGSPYAAGAARLGRRGQADGGVKRAAQLFLTCAIDGSEQFCPPETRVMPPRPVALTVAYYALAAAAAAAAYGYLVAGMALHH